MTAVVALRGRPSTATLGELRERITDLEEEVADIRADALRVCRFALPEARRLRLYFQDAESRHGEQLAANIVGRLEALERQLAPSPETDEPEAAAA